MALYAGDALIRPQQPKREHSRRTLGPDADRMLVEAFSGQGVIVSPLDEYIDFNIIGQAFNYQELWQERLDHRPQHAPGGANPAGLARAIDRVTFFYLDSLPGGENLLSSISHVWEQTPE